MASLTVQQTQDLRRSSLRPEAHPDVHRGFILLGQGSKSVETATNHRGSLSSRTQVNGQNAPYQYALSHISQTSTYIEQAGGAIQTSTANKQNPVRGFFIKKREGISSSPQSNVSKWVSISREKGFQIQAKPTDQLLAESLESTYDELTKVPQKPAKKLFTLNADDMLPISQIGSVDAQRSGTRRSHFALKKLDVREDSDMSRRKSVGSTISIQTNHTSSPNKPGLVGGRFHLTDLLTSPDWQDNTFNFDEISRLTTQKASNTKTITSCIKSSFKISTQTRTRFRSVPADKTTHGFAFGSRRDSQNSPSKTVSFSRNVLVYTY